MTTETIELAVPTVHCNACKLNIEEALEELGGVTSSSVDVDAKQVTVSFDPSTVQRDSIVATITEAGYPVDA